MAIIEIIDLTPFIDQSAKLSSKGFLKALKIVGKVAATSVAVIKITESKGSLVSHHKKIPKKAAAKKIQSQSKKVFSPLKSEIKKIAKQIKETAPMAHAPALAFLES